MCGSSLPEIIMFNLEILKKKCALVSVHVYAYRQLQIDQENGSSCQFFSHFGIQSLLSDYINAYIIDCFIGIIFVMITLYYRFMVINVELRSRRIDLVGMA